MERILVATNRSPTAAQVLTWAVEMAERFTAELIVLQVLPDNGQAEVDQGAIARATQELEREVVTVAGPTARCLVVTHDDPAMAIVEMAATEKVDLVVVGSVGMRDRTEFLLHNVPNRISHAAPCSVVIVQTTAVRDPSPPGGGDDVDDRLLGRATHVGAVFTKLGIRHLFGEPGSTGGRHGVDDGRDRGREEARRLRDALEELGPTFAKLGQVLSTRSDLLPPAFAEELASLQDDVTPLSEAEVVAVMEEELGVPWEDVFETIDAQPLAAGTIAQVHRATLSGGQRVVLKVQRPTARADILTDLALLERFAEKAQRRESFRQVADVAAIVEHLTASLRRELDFTREAANIERIRQVLAPFGRLDVPGVHDTLSTGRLLVMEDIQGVPVRQAPEGPARRDAGRQLLESYYRQILTEGFFHADPHPGNLLWWNDKLYFLDCGMVGEVGPEVRELLMLLLLAFWQQDAPFLAEVLLMLGGHAGDTDVDLATLTAELAALMEHYRRLPLRDLQLGPVLQEISQVSLRHAIRLPASLLLTGKALAQVQLATAELDPTLDVLSVAGSFIVRSTRERVRRGLDPTHLFYEAQKLQVRSVRLIEAVERLVGARPGPKLQVQFRGTERLEETVRHASRHLALALTATGALVGAAMTANSRLPRWLPGVLGGAGGALTTGLVADLIRTGGR